MEFLGALAVRGKQKNFHNAKKSKTRAGLTVLSTMITPLTYRPDLTMYSLAYLILYLDNECYQ